MIEFFFDVYHRQINGTRLHKPYIKSTAELSRFIAYCEDNSEKITDVGYNIRATKRDVVLALVREKIDVAEYLAYDGKKQMYVARFEVKMFERMKREYPEVKF